MAKPHPPVARAAKVARMAVSGTGRPADLSARIEKAWSNAVSP